MAAFTAGSRLTAAQLEALRSPYRAVVTRSSSQAITTATVTPISFTAEEVDQGGLIAVTSTTITLNVAGTWLMVGGLVYAANATGVRACLIEINGIGNYQDGSTSLPAVGSAADVCRMTASIIRVCAAGDTATLSAYQTSGGNLNVTSARFAVHLLAAA